MTNQNTASPTRRKRRYTVSRLLELAPRAEDTGFDLSKFTYDAARAGVVPPLGSCAMSTRRTVSDQPHNWSRESSDSPEDFIVYAGNRSIRPQRQPVLPPAESRAQQDKGFARFLEKHSSPTHQRVTAGGRIVPMEQRPRPPTFPMPSSTKTTHELRKDTVTDLHPHQASLVNEKHTNGMPEIEIEVKARQTFPPQLSIRAESFEKNTMGLGIEPSTMFSVEGFGDMPGSAQSPTFSMVQPGQLYPGTTWDAYAVHSPTMFPITAMPINQGMNAYHGMGIPFSPTVYPYGEAYGMPSPNLPVAESQNPQLHCQQMLSAARTLFEELDKQLKSIDRHRAMSNPDINIATQRMMVVQERADAKNNMTYWEERAARELGVLQAYPVAHHGATLNVQAASYIPLGSGPANSGLPCPEGTNNDPRSEGLDTETIVHPVAARAPRRAIPIVAPPPPTPPAEKMLSVVVDNIMASPASDHAVDEWGVRIGRAPPHIERQQNEMLAAILREASLTPEDQAAPVIDVMPLASSKSSNFVPPLTAGIPDTISEGDSENVEWLPTNPGRAPASVEAYYELQLDAMRLPQGLVSKVRLPDGTITEVPGRGLQRPPSFEMDDFEKRYWTSKPTLTKVMTDQFVDVRPCSNGPSQEQVSFGVSNFSMASTSPAKENVRATVSSQSSQSIHQYQGVIGQVGHEATMRKDLSNGGYEPAASSSSTPDLGLASVKQNTGPSHKPWSPSDDNSTVPQQPSRQEWGSAHESHLNKGYSSVCVQNVHVMGHLPHMLDGTTDSQKSSAKSLLSAATKVRSPRLIHRPTPTRGAWFGPHFRQVGNQVSEGEDVFRTQIHKGHGL